MASVSASHLLTDSVPTCSRVLRYKRSVLQTELWGRITTQPTMIPHLTLGFMGFQAPLICGFYICTCYRRECFLSPILQRLETTMCLAQDHLVSTLQTQVYSTLCGYVAMPRYFCSMDVGQDDGLLHMLISIALGEITTSELPV